MNLPIKTPNDSYIEAIRYNERTAAEHSNTRLKDEFGGHTPSWVKGGTMGDRPNPTLFGTN